MKFARTFCNTSGFGISNEGSLKFALGETKGEFSKSTLVDKIDLNNLKDEILTDVANTCNYYELTENDLAQLNFE